MNRWVVCAGMLVTTMIAGVDHHYHLSISSRWEPIGTHIPHEHSRWILVGDITVKKKVPEICTVDRLVFKWQGSRMQSLFGSLYLYDDKKGWMITPDHLVADSRWNSQRQELTFELSKPMHIGITTRLGLVLLVSPDLETILTHGSFSLDTSCLPEHMAQSLNDQVLKISWGTPARSVS